MEDGEEDNLNNSSIVQDRKGLSEADLEEKGSVRGSTIKYPQQQMG